MDKKIQVEGSLLNQILDGCCDNKKSKDGTNLYKNLVKNGYKFDVSVVERVLRLYSYTRNYSDS